MYAVSRRCHPARKSRIKVSFDSSTVRSAMPPPSPTVLSTNTVREATYRGEAVTGVGTSHRRRHPVRVSVGDAARRVRSHSSATPGGDDDDQTVDDEESLSVSSPEMPNLEIPAEVL